MQAIFNPHFHLEGGVEFRIGAECVNNKIQLFGDITKSPANRCSQKVSTWKRNDYAAAKLKKTPKKLFVMEKLPSETDCNQMNWEDNGRYRSLTFCPV